VVRDPSPRLSLLLLGRFDLSGPDGVIDLPSRKLAGLLTYLACTVPRPQRRETLSALLWGSHFDLQAKQNLRQALFRLRKVLGQDALEGDGEVVSLNPAAVASDVGRFEDLVRDGSRDALRAAAELYRGPLVDDVTISEEGWNEWLTAERERLLELALGALLGLGEQELAAGCAEYALKVGQRAIALNNMREDAHRLIVRALTAAGRRAEALKHYQNLVVMLKRELNAEPDEATKSLAVELRSAPSPSRSPAVGQNGEPGQIDPPNKPSIAVLSFQNLSGEPDQEYFADGIVEDIITALSCFRSLFVISRNSSFAYKGRIVDAKQVGRELGVRYVLEGSVRKSGTRVRIGGQLIDTSTGAHLWADRFDGALEDIFDLQDRITARVVGVIAPRLEQAEIERAKRKPTQSLDAYDYYLRGLASFYQVTRESTREALQLFRRAIDLDADFAAPHAMAVWCMARYKTLGWTTDPAYDVAETERLAQRAVQLDRNDALSLSTAGFALAYVVGDPDRGASLVDRALALNPNLAAAWHFSGFVRAYLGEPDVAIYHLANAMRLNPLDPLFYALQTGMALAHFCAGRYDEASSWADRALQQPGGQFYHPALRVAAASNALAGRPEEAQKAMTRLRGIDPALRVSNLNEYITLRGPEHFAKYAEGLRKAGLPE